MFFQENTAKTQSNDYLSSAGQRCSRRCWINPTTPHRILDSTVAHATVGFRPVATPAAETMSPETLPAHLH